MKKLLKKIISNIPNEFDIVKGKKVLTKKRSRVHEKKDYKKENNFLCFYDSDNNLILNKDIKITNKTNYENSIKENKQKFFGDFIVEKDKEDNNNKISENPSNIENFTNTSEKINNQQLNLIVSIDRNKDELIKDIINKDRHTNEFTPEYNKKLKNIILEMYSEKKEKIETFRDKNITSYYCGFYDISILNNPVKFPFYYLYRNKITKDIKIFIEDNSQAKIFNYMDGNEIKGDDYKKEINTMIDAEKFHEDNLIMFCFIVDQS